MDLGCLGGVGNPADSSRERRYRTLSPIRKPLIFVVWPGQSTRNGSKGQVCSSALTSGRLTFFFFFFYFQKSPLKEYQGTRLAE